MAANSRRIRMSPRIKNALYVAMRDAAHELDISHNAFLEKALEFYLAFGVSSASVNGHPAKVHITAPKRWC